MSSITIKSENVRTEDGTYYVIELYMDKPYTVYKVDVYYAGHTVFHGVYAKRENANRAFTRQVKKYKPTDPERPPRSANPHTREFYPEETRWLEILTAYEWYPLLVTVTYDDALELLNAWKAEGIDDIPPVFLAPHGYKILADLWNKYIA